MKKYLFLITISVSGLFTSPVFSQNRNTTDSLGLPGDNLNLYSVLSIFQASATLEEFEKKLNDKNSNVNNLDLNNDDKVDYLKVVDNVKGTSHAIVLKNAVSANEVQDVAIIEVDKDEDGKVHIQIVGDEALYGKDYIVEPNETSTADLKKQGTPNPGYTGGNTTVVNNTTNNYYNNASVASDSYYWYPASSWAIVRYMYAPSYVVYASPWSWGFYPSYWYAWTPWYYHAYYRHWYHCRDYWRITRTYRCHNAHAYYAPRRSTSMMVVERRDRGDYRRTYSHPELAYRSDNKGRGSVNDRNREISRDTKDNDHSTREQYNNRSEVRDNNVSEKKSERVSRTESQKTIHSTRDAKPTQRSNNTVKPSSSAPRSNSGSMRSGSNKNSSGGMMRSSSGSNRSSGGGHNSNRGSGRR